MLAALPDPTLFVDLLQALKESVLAALASIVAEREEIVRQSENHMYSPPSGESWSFSRYFLLKVSGHDYSFLPHGVLTYFSLTGMPRLFFREYGTE